jgi:hypothetical protein
MGGEDQRAELVHGGQEQQAPRSMARLMGVAHQACMRLSTSVTAMAARPVSVSLTTSHLVRVMLWFQAR